MDPVLLHLTDRPRTAGQIAKDLNRPPALVLGTLTDLAKRGVVQKVGDGFARLPVVFTPKPPRPKPERNPPRQFREPGAKRGRKPLSPEQRERGIKRSRQYYYEKARPDFLRDREAKRAAAHRMVLANIAALSAPAGRPTVKAIQNAVCDAYEVSITDMLRRDPRKDVSWPRNVAMYLAREITGFSFPAIGQMFDHRDHTTIISAFHKVRNERDARRVVEVQALLRALHETQP